jgi:hypothetical protein
MDVTETDSRGLEASTASDRAAVLYRQGLDLLLSAWPGAAEMLDAATAADPTFALAHAARARLYAICAEPTEARVRIAEATRLVALRGTDREQSHIATLAFAINGQPVKAMERAIAHLESWPLDVVIFS